MGIIVQCHDNSFFDRHLETKHFCCFFFFFFCWYMVVFGCIRIRYGAHISVCKVIYWVGNFGQWAAWIYCVGKLIYWVGKCPPSLPVIYLPWNGPLRFVVNCLRLPDQRSTVIQRSICLRNALRPPHLVGRTLHQNVVHCLVQYIAGVESHAEVIRGRKRVKLLRNALWLPNVVGKTPDQSVMHWWGQRSLRGQLGSSTGQIA